MKLKGTPIAQSGNENKQPAQLTGTLKKHKEKQQLRYYLHGKDQSERNMNSRSTVPSVPVQSDNPVT